MEIKAVLFDMDGTLVPMNQEVFTKAYFKELAKVLCPLGIEPQKLIDTVWAGTKAMVMNNGQKRNVNAFWDCFSEKTGLNTDRFQAASDNFYIKEFHNARYATGENPLAVEAVREAHKNNRQVVLATNPIFPMEGQKTRMSWVGLKAEDFNLVTSYETDSYCKPNPQYFTSICERIGIEPKNCLIIGNDETEDMYAGTQAGLNTYLVTDCRIASEKHPWTGRQGTFAEMLEMLRTLDES
ncbi:MAG: HAD family hydrolase [Acutalibacteraceae bacterium]